MITIFDWFGYELSTKKRYSLIKEAGFDGVLMWWSSGFGRGAYRHAPEIARQEGLFIENIHGPVMNQHALGLNTLEGQDVYTSYIKCIEDCADFSIPTLVLHLPSDDHPINPIGLDRVSKITEMAEKRNVNIAFENLRNLGNLRAVFSHNDSAKLGFCYDSGHHQRHYEDISMLDEFGARLMALHLHDNNGERGQHGLPFDGPIDWEDTMKKIMTTGYLGHTAIEPMNWAYEDMACEEFLEGAYEKAQVLDRLRGQV